MSDDFLKTLKKHIDDGIIEAVPHKISKTQIHNFGESMKGINEFIGAVQVLSLNLNKVKNLSEKIEWIDEVLKTEDNKNTISMLNMQKSSHISNIKYVVEGTKFIGVVLFDTNLSCVINGSEFTLFVENPLSIKNGTFAYCTHKLNEIDMLIARLNNMLNSAESSPAGFEKESAEIDKNMLRKMM